MSELSECLLNVLKEIPTTNENKRRTSRSKSRHREKREQRSKSTVNDKTVPNKLNFVEEKILNISSKTDLFLNVLKKFENVMNDLELEDDSIHFVISKLTGTKELIEKKIYDLSAIDSNLNNSFDASKKYISPSLPIFGVEFIKSEIANESSVNGLKSYKKFLNKIECPFCSEIQIDKNHFVCHLDNQCQTDEKKLTAKKNTLRSAFQILPNNFFKCNVCTNENFSSIKKYFVHLSSDKHILNYIKEKRFKQYTDHIYCSLCKNLIPNNFTQIDFHIRSEKHKKRGELEIDIKCVLEKRTPIVYIPGKRFKCIVCPTPYPLLKNTEEVLKHSKTQKHEENVLKLFFTNSDVFCTFCDTNEIINKFNSHLDSNIHRENEKKKDDDRVSVEICFFCGFSCDDLSILYSHMNSFCHVIDDYRKKVEKKEKSTATCKEANKEIEKEKKNEKNEKNDNQHESKEFSIFVKGVFSLPKLLKLLSTYGKIKGTKLSTEYDVTEILFTDKESVEKIMGIRDIIKTYEKNLKISDNYDEVVFESDKKVNTINLNTASVNEDTSDSTIDDFADGKDQKSSSENTTKTEPSNLLQKLIRNLSLLFENEKIGVDVTVTEEIKNKFIQTLNGKNCVIVGFQACKIPTDILNFFCESIDENFLLHDEHAKINFAKIEKSDLWENVTVHTTSPAPYVKCRYKNLKKICTVTTAPTTKILTTIFRFCIQKNKLLRPFTFILVTWLSFKKLRIAESEWGLMTLIIFFLTNKKIVTNIGTLYEAALKEEPDNPLGVFLSSETSNSNVSELLFEFLKFLQTFDFENYAICLNFPKGKFSKNIAHAVSHSKEIWTNDCYVWLIDFRCDINLASGIQKEDLKSLLKVVNKTIEQWNI